MSDAPPVVGQNVRRVDGYVKVTGAAQYAGDLVLAGMLHGKVLRSPYASARLTRIDTTAAEELPGVVAVLTGRDLADLDPYYGHALKDRPIVALDRVRFIGEPVAAVAAIDLATARAALELIDVEYEQLPAALTIEAALAPDAPHLHDTPSLRAGLFHGLGEIKLEPGNICYHHHIERGDSTALFAEAAIVVEGEYTFPSVYQYAMEPHTVVAFWEGADLTVHASCQHPFLVRAELADLFGLQASHVRVVVPYLGGGFGSKSYTKMEPITAALARLARRPVRIANTVEEAMLTTRRHNMRCWMRTAATADGRLLAREARLWFDTGAYADNGPRVVATGADAAPGPYRWEGLRIDGWCVYTNTSPAGSYRAFGATHLQWIAESQVDEVARRAGLDRVEIRRRNLLRPGEYVRPGGKPLDADLVGDVEKVAAALGWDTPKPPGVGRGVSVGLLAAGAQPVSVALLRLEADGTATLLCSTTEVGQGARTVFSQIVAEELGLPMDRIRVPGGDTQVTTYDRSTGASRSTTISGLAVQRAARDLRERLLAIAGDLLDLPPSPDGEEKMRSSPYRALQLRDGAVCHEDISLSFTELIRRYFGMAGGELIGHGEVRPEPGAGTYAAGPVFWEVCVGGAEVSVDRDTGRIHVHRLTSVADVGKAINPRLVEAQEMGGVLQGLGNAIHEEMILQDGQLLNGSLLDYHVPTMADLPDVFTSVLVENGDGPGPYGAKGVGEGAFAAVPAAIVNALADLGIMVHELPLTPERIWRLLQATPMEANTDDGAPVTATRRA